MYYNGAVLFINSILIFIGFYPIALKNECVKLHNFEIDDNI